MDALVNDFHLPLDAMATTANAYASAHGVQVERKNAETGTSYYEAAPMSLLPNAYPATAFQQAQSLATAFNELVDRISQDATFLQDTLGGGVAAADPYTAKLLTLYKDIYVGDNASPFAVKADRLGIHRSDYMLNGGVIKQIELNTIAASFAGLSCRVSALHSYLVKRFANVPAVMDFLSVNKKVVLGEQAPAADTDSDAGVPVNPALDRLPLAMKVAVERYKERFAAMSSVSDQQPIVLFVVQEGETNTVDQRLLEFELFSQHGIPVVRKSLTRLASEAKVDPKTGALMLANKEDGSEQEVALVYFRAGYAPTDYPDGDDGVEWQARALLERSRATKAPSLGYHLAGTKKVQQELARPGVVERFFDGDQAETTVRGLRAAFAGLYSLGDDATSEDLAAVKEVMEGAQGRYVLKPQREGGGYNFYGDNLAEKLRENIDSSGTTMVLDKKLGEYILMERLFPPEQKALLMRSGRVEGSGDSVSELGCYGTIVATCDGKIVHNEYAGFLLRTKFSNVDEGGVASGFATLSSPYLC